MNRPCTFPEALGRASDNSHPHLATMKESPTIHPRAALGGNEYWEKE
jgi:hypothetical protein